MQVSTLRPGLLVSLKTTIAGNVRYEKATLEPEHLTDSGMERARWETTRTVTDPAEHEAAKVARGKARSLISGVCASSAFGLLCPESNAEKLEAAIREARAVADTFNSRASLSRVTVYVITGRIAPDDVEAMRAINSEVRELLADMESGIKNLDASAVREAASKARNLSTMLVPASAERMQAAIDAARSAARKITKAGEQAIAEIDATVLTTIAGARTAFLDLDGTDSAIAAPEAETRVLDLAPKKILQPDDYLTEGGNAVWPQPSGIQAAGPPAPAAPQFEIE